MVCLLLKLAARAELMPHFPPHQSLLSIPSYYLLQGKLQGNVFLALELLRTALSIVTEASHP